MCSSEFGHRALVAFHASHGPSLSRLQDWVVRRQIHASKIMSSPIHHISAIRYYRDHPGWDQEDIANPTFDQIEAAIRRMDDYCFPLVQLNPGQHEDDEGILNFVGGGGRIAVFSAQWCFEDPNGSDDEVALWKSDQGYFTEEKNILTDIDDVLHLALVFSKTSSSETIQAETERILLRHAKK
jgi:hypothetical protein